MFPGILLGNCSCGVCMCASTHVCIHACVCACVHPCMCVCMSVSCVCVLVCIHACVCACLYRVCVCLCASMHVCVHVCIHACVCANFLQNNSFSFGLHSILPRSETHSLHSTDMKYRLFCVRVQVKNEACLLEISTHGKPLSTYLRSRGSYVVYHVSSRKLYLWQGSKVTKSLRKSALTAARKLRNRYVL